MCYSCLIAAAVDDGLVMNCFVAFLSFLLLHSGPNTVCQLGCTWDDVLRCSMGCW